MDYGASMPLRQRTKMWMWLWMPLMCAALACGPGVTIERVPVGEGEGEGEGDDGEGQSEGEGEASEGEGEVVGEGEGETRSLSHVREVRGVWLATVFGIDWPRNTAASDTQKQAELEDMINALADAGINAVYFQVRAESDALYRSDLEPWSRFLTGTQGQDPGFDPLEVAVATAHARGIELHAWFNPYRGMASNAATAATHITRTLPDASIDHGNGVWMDPASTDVRTHVLNVIADVVTRYAVDGVVFDDYFYPYPSGEEFDDDSSYAAYEQAGGMRQRSDWRRDNVNALIEATAMLLQTQAPSLRFAVSPFGIYRPGIPAGIVGLDAYEDISCDALRWLNEDWVDVLMPQLYWPSTRTAQSFPTLLDWWTAQTDGDGRVVVPALNWAALGDSGFDLEEFELQWLLGSTTAGAAGGVGFRALSLLDDADLLALHAGLWSTPALPPENPRAQAVVAAPVVVAQRMSDDVVTVELTSLAPRMRHVVYVERGADSDVHRVVPMGVQRVDLPMGVGSADVWWITRVDDNNVESLARRIAP
jgi:uncharacterized lipoprotein YddW (UPF0748 family)